MRIDLGGVPLMSPNCWAVIDEAVRSRPYCRYLEWGSGNSTLALLRSALAEGVTGLSIVSIENDFAFANAMCTAIFAMLEKAHAKAVISVERIEYPRPSFLEALRKDDFAARYEADFLKLLWCSRHDDFWIPPLDPEELSDRRGAIAERYLIWLACATAFRWSRLHRAIASSHPLAPAQVPEPPEGDCDFFPIAPNAPTRIRFDSDLLQVTYVFVPRLRNRLWRRPAILDGSYYEFADYVSVALEGQFDVILVDGRARTSCLKRVHHEGLVAPGGILFLHDAHRPAYVEALRLFGTWSFIRGSGDTTDRDTTDRAQGEQIEEGAHSPSPPRVRSGTSMKEIDVAFDRELYFYEVPLPASI